MANKSEMFKGVAATDIHPTFKADLITLASLPVEDGSMLAVMTADDAREIPPTSVSALSKKVAQKFGLPSEQATSLARVARSFGSSYARRDDDPAGLADDLVAMQLIPASSRDVVVRFLTTLRPHAKDLMARSARQQATIGGGYHLQSSSVFTDFRAAFDRFDVTDVNLATFEPTVTGFVPVVTLQLDLHNGDDSKTVIVRLPESDLTILEETLKLPAFNWLP